MPHVGAQKWVAALALAAWCLHSGALADPAGQAASSGSELNCKDDSGSNVDWFVAYKLPKERGSTNALIKEGHAYAFLTSGGASGWQMSGLRVTDPTSMFGRTLVQKNMAQVLTVGYNDQPPDGSTHASHAHAKGFVLVSSSSGAGVWVSHSVPGFPGVLSATSGYDYPATATVYGQNILCVTLDRENIDKLGQHLQSLHPFVFYSGPASYVPTLAAPGRVPYLVRVFSKDLGTAVPRSDAATLGTLRTRGNLALSTFAKRAKPEIDLFAQSMAPHLGVNLRTQSWLRSVGACLPKISFGNFYAQSILSLSLTARAGSVSATLAFSTSRDHSKWAISDNPAKPWLCIADVNRKEPQQRRGGGAVCLQQLTAWAAYNATWTQMKPDVGGNTLNCPA